jgi:hypothetical protein
MGMEKHTYKVRAFVDRYYLTKYQIEIFFGPFDIPALKSDSVRHITEDNSCTYNTLLKNSSTTKNIPPEYFSKKKQKYSGGIFLEVYTKTTKVDINTNKTKKYSAGIFFFFF